MTQPIMTPHQTAAQALRCQLDESAGRFISDARLEMMYMMTGGSESEALKMALGYVIQTLDLLLQNQPTDPTGYRQAMTVCRQQVDRLVPARAAGGGPFQRRAG